MRQNRRPGERLFVDYAGMTIAVMIDGSEHQAQVFVASMGVSGRLYAEVTLTQKIEDCRAGFAPARERRLSTALATFVILRTHYEIPSSTSFTDRAGHSGCSAWRGSCCTPGPVHSSCARRSGTVRWIFSVAGQRCGLPLSLPAARRLHSV